MSSEFLNSLKAQNMFNLDGVVAVVTGGGSGIGLMISSTLMSNGAVVYVVDLPGTDIHSKTKKFNDASKDGSAGKMIPLEADISKKSEVSKLASHLSSACPNGVALLFNNAGIAIGSAARPESATASAYKKAFFDDIHVEDFLDVYKTNAMGPYWMTMAFLPLFEQWKEIGEEERTGIVTQVVMTSSMNGWTKDSNTGGRSFPYLFSKSAVGHATSSLARELLPLGVRVNGIAPGLFATGMTIGYAKSEPQYDEAGFWKPDPGTSFGFKIPTVPTGGRPKDMGAVVLGLVANHFVNGETVLIDGGTLLEHASSY